MRSAVIGRTAIVAAALLVGFIGAPHSAAAQGDAVATRTTELAKWEDAQTYKAKSGPGNTAWDAPYRSLIQTDSNATSKGLPTHAAAAAKIKAAAAIHADSLTKHKEWVLFIKWASQAYRPDTATADLKTLYTDLVNMQFGGPTTAIPIKKPPRG